MEGNACCRGLIRGNEGEQLGGFSKRIGICSAYIVELWGVYECLRLVIKLGFKAIDINVDYYQVVNDVNFKKFSNVMGRNLITKIKSYM